MTTPRDREAVHLAQCEQHIALGERHIVEQRLRIERLREHGRVMPEAEDILRTMQELQEQRLAHREEILKRLASLDAGPC